MKPVERISTEPQVVSLSLTVNDSLLLQQSHFTFSPGSVSPVTVLISDIFASCSTGLACTCDDGFTMIDLGNPVVQCSPCVRTSAGAD